MGIKISDRFGSKVIEVIVSGPTGGGKSLIRYIIDDALIGSNAETVAIFPGSDSFYIKQKDNSDADG